jgi:hypothetical protein
MMFDVGFTDGNDRNLYFLLNFSKQGWAHRGTFQCTHIMLVLTSFCFVLQNLQRFLVPFTGKCFPAWRRTSSGTLLTPGLFLVRKLGLPLLLISRPAVRCLMSERRKDNWSRPSPWLQFHIIKLLTITRSIMKKRRRCHHFRDRLPIAYLWDISGTNMSQWPCDRQLKKKNSYQVYEILFTLKVQET